MNTEPAHATIKLMEPPFGFHWGRYGREPNRLEQLTIARAVELRTEGFSIRGIALKLSDEGWTNRSYNAILPTQVARWLKRAETG